ncbi:MAG: cytidine deaminase [Ruminococcaceae bacterium]|nr:cytidine deaminase [Oscillospiraceae bacterium]
MTTFEELYKLAKKAREASYCPYSKISVGAALLCESGRIFTGANIENSAFSPSVCAERVAFFSAVNAGERKFKAIAVAGGPLGEKPKSTFPPCGVCRQVMSEFCGKDFKIIFGSDKEASFSELLPYGFNEDFLK